MPRLVFIALLLTAGTAAAAPATGLKNPFAGDAGPSEPPSLPAGTIESDLKDPFAGAGEPATDLKNPWDRPGEPRDPFVARAAEPTLDTRDGADPRARRSAPSPVAENVHGLVDPWARPPTQLAPAGELPAPTSDLKNPFAAAPAGAGVVDPWTRPATQRPRRPAR